MHRLLMTIGALTFALFLGGCRAPELDAIEVDFTIGDQCFYTLSQRPDDCYERAPCMWSDADVRLSEDDGRYTIDAGPGGWEVRSEPSERVVHASASSPEALARQMPRVLAALHESPPPISESCVSLRPDQDTRTGDVAAFHRALTRAGVRRVDFFIELVDDPFRLARITLSRESDAAALIGEMRRFAEEYDLVFSQGSWEGERRFRITGDGLAISTFDVQVGSQSASNVMFALHPQSDGTLPTEPQMDHLFESFAAAVERVDGASITLETTSQ